MTSRLAGILFWLARVTERPIFRPFHQRVRRFYEGTLQRFVKKRLIKAFPESKLDLILRHSAATGEGFNAFMSDADFTVVIGVPFSLEKSDQILNHYLRLKTFLPMLGEIEIFSRSEFERLNALWQREGSLLQLLRDIKKIRWMERKIESHSHPYHIYKAKRATQRLVFKYEDYIPQIDALKVKQNYRLLGKGLSRELKNLVPVHELSVAITSSLPRSFSTYSHDIDATVGSDTKAALCLDREVAICLLSLLPSHDDDDIQLKAVLDLIRNITEIHSFHIIILQYELLYANASPRIHLDFRNVSWQWRDCLIRQLKIWATPELYTKTLGDLNSHSII